jgi:hypothetical protein
MIYYVTTYLRHPAVACASIVYNMLHVSNQWPSKPVMTMRITIRDRFLMVMVTVTEISDSKKPVMVRFFRKRGKNQTKPDFQTLSVGAIKRSEGIVKRGCEWTNGVTTLSLQQYR